MITAIRRMRQKLDAVAASWTPPQDVTMLTLRPMPWELDRTGHPTEAFWADIVTLAANGWCNDCGYFPALVADKAELRSRSGTARFKPFGRLLVATRFSTFGTNELILSSVLSTPSGEVVATLTTRLALVQAVPAALPVVPLRSAIAPAPAKDVARAA